MGGWRSDASEAAWKWRHKVRNIGQPTEKTLADYDTDSSPKGSGDVVEEAETGPGGKRPAPMDTTLGSHPCVKTLYEGPCSSVHYKNWVDYPPKQLSKSAAKAQDRIAIKLYKVKDLKKPVVKNRYSLAYHMIEIQNLSLVAAIQPILKQEGHNIELDFPATFNAPFQSLYFCYDAIVAKSKTISQDDTLRTFMLLLIKVLKEVFQEVWAKKQSLMNSGLVSFSIAWTYFRRDAPIIGKSSHCELISKLVRTTYTTDAETGEEVLRLRSRIRRFNGEAFAWEDGEFDVPYFEGNVAITELPHRPLEFHPDSQAVAEKMTARGRMVLDYQGLVYCNYNGIGLARREDDQLEKFNVDGRILIDVAGFNKFELGKGKGGDENQVAPESSAEEAGQFRYQYQDQDDGARVLCAKDPFMAKVLAFTAKLGLQDEEEKRPEPQPPRESKRLSDEVQQNNKNAMLARPDELKYVSPMLEGYCLKNKRWLLFAVEDASPMTWNDEAFDHLVYDEEQKDLVLSFVQSHDHSNQQQIEDVVIGKGQGLIILLSGPPGTGKTLTAEAVADRARRPLFYLQAEDLGVSASTLGANLKRIFEMATDWDAVVLLDEADVFMAERYPNDIARNELVSIFLRELEYTRAIVFLTTNMYQNVDSAFRSRLSLHLLFHPLTTNSRLTIWRKFLSRLQRASTNPTVALGGSSSSSEKAKLSTKTSALQNKECRGVDINENDLKELARWPLNGREIKTAIKMVKLWCDYKAQELTLARLENGIKVTSPHATKMAKEGDADIYND